MVASVMLNKPGDNGTVVETDDEKSGAKSLMKATLVYGLTRVLASTLPVKVTDCPTSVVLFSMYMLASIVLLPIAPGPPAGVYQNALGSLMLLGPSVRTE